MKKISIALLFVALAACSSQEDRAKTPAPAPATQAATFTTVAKTESGHCTPEFIDLLNRLIVHTPNNLSKMDYPERVAPMQKALEELEAFRKHYAGVECELGDRLFKVTEESEEAVAFLKRVQAADAKMLPICPPAFMTIWSPLVEETTSLLIQALSHKGTPEANQTQSRSIDARLTELEKAYPGLHCLIKYEEEKGKSPSFLPLNLEAEAAKMRALTAKVRTGDF